MNVLWVVDLVIPIQIIAISVLFLILKIIVAILMELVVLIPMIDESVEYPI
jgi:hypothetical protein